MKKSNKTTITLIGLFLLFILTHNIHAQTIDFSGTWKFNVKDSKAPGLNPASFSQFIKISQDSKTMSINKIKAGQDERSGYVEVLKFDGSPTETITPSKLKRSATFKWLSDHSGFTEVFVAKDDYDNVQQKATLVYMLSKNGRTLIIKNDLQDGDRSFQSEIVYDKQ